MTERGSCIVVGAGISGLLAARSLLDEGWEVTVVDEGRGVGGRMATRRMIDRRVGTGTFDYGAQVFTVREDRFQASVDAWLEAGVATEWSRGFPDASGGGGEDGYPRYRGATGMTSIPKYLARDLDVRTGERAISARIEDGSWVVLCEDGLEVYGGALLLTAPVPQSLALVSDEVPDAARTELERVAYDPCVAVLALLDGPSGLPPPGGVQIKGEPLDWIGDNQQKGISEAPAITIHAGPRWSAANHDVPDDEVARALLGFAEESLGRFTSSALETSVVRWRYSWVTGSHPERCLVAAPRPPLVFAGDGFGSPKVEGAALSGLAAADALLGRAGFSRA
jgi:predicted NAD/FAD-dependent oxidoreductase